MKTGIIFDMDGTLWDSTQQVAQAWSTVTQPKLGKAVTGEDMYRVMGMPMDKLVQELFPGYGLSMLEAVAEECFGLENSYLAAHGAAIYPGVVDTLKLLAQDYPLYIVSNCQAGYIEAFLSYYSLEECFQDHACFGDNNRQKGENIALIIERNGLGRGIYVGDIQADYEAALEGGAEFIHAAYGFGQVDVPVPELPAFTELPELLKTLIQA